jgi:hypothetical protein
MRGDLVNRPTNTKDVTGMAKIPLWGLSAKQNQPTHVGLRTPCLIIYG